MRATENLARVAEIEILPLPAAKALQPPQRPRDGLSKSCELAVDAARCDELDDDWRGRCARRSGIGTRFGLQVHCWA